jgi:uncharacterized protein
MPHLPASHPHYPRPAGRVVMWQRWADLLFLHWNRHPDLVQRTLPPGLTVDTFQDQAWICVVPFFMQAIRPAGLFPVPWLSSFLELNVRTYVRDAAGRPGVWFYSLDCNRWPAVEIARRGFQLPYQHAAMQARREADGTIDYQCSRRPESGHSGATYRYRGVGGVFHAPPGSLEFFLAERYRLFSWSAKRRQLYTGEVWHPPYPLQAVEIPQWSAAPAAWNGDFVLEGPPAAQHFSAGVEVGIFPLRSA